MELDLVLAPYDLWATYAHVLMLLKQKIIKRGVARKIMLALHKIEWEVKAGSFKIDPNLGLHLTIEKKVIEKIGDDGYFMHTARSRNDQVATAEMLYLREKALSLLLKLLKLLKLLMEIAANNIETVMPGYTHMQPAKPTTFGQWCLSYFDMLMRVFDTLCYFYNKFDLCPLGAVESYGTSWPIDRNYSAKLLGFTNVWEIPQEAISSRGLVQLGYLSALKDFAIVMSKIAQDLILFNTFEYGMIGLGKDVASQMDRVTGSSVMPQKANPDVLELIRSVAPQVIGAQSTVANLLSGLPMGYNRDTREVKEYVENSFHKVSSGILSLIDVFATLIVKKERMLQLVYANYSLATDLADYMAQKTGLAYRKIYRLVGVLVREKKNQNRILSDLTTKEIISEGKSLGLIFTITDRELKQALDPFHAIEKRKHLGGSNPEIMKDTIKKRKLLWKKREEWVNNQLVRIKMAKKLTVTEVNKYVVRFQTTDTNTSLRGT